MNELLEWAEEEFKSGGMKIGYAMENVTAPPFPVNKVAMPKGGTSSPIVYVNQGTQQARGCSSATFR